MAETNFKVFAESADDLMSDINYGTDSQRINGVEPGLAKADLHNKLYKQSTVMVAALAQVLVERGFNAMDNDYDGLVKGLRQAFAGSINGQKPNASGDVEYKLLSIEEVYPVGCIYTTTVATNPATVFGFGTWEQIASGRCLIGASSAYPAGSVGGEEKHTLALTEIPSHSHGISIGSNGSHKHNRGTMNITGAFDGNINDPYHEGAFYNTGRGWNGSDGGKGGGIKGFDASRSWTGETSAAGNHSHDASIGSSGGSGAHNNMQPYLSVYFWKRTA